jgi:hypothetical protein
MRAVRLFTVLCVLIFPVPLQRRCGTARLKHGCVHDPPEPADKEHSYRQLVSALGIEM